MRTFLREYAPELLGFVILSLFLLVMALYAIYLL